MALRSTAARRLFHRICFEDSERDEDFGAELAWRTESAERFFARLPGWLAVEGRSVLDVGCGAGVTSMKVAQMGARRSVGVDIQSTQGASDRVRTDFPEVADRCEFKTLEDGDLSRLDPEKFDVVLSQDSFEHYDDPETFAARLAEPLAPGGLLVIGFGPLWRAPYGGHLQFMTPVPWVHLIFSEQVVLAERRRFRPEEDPGSYEEILGGLNRMTLARFERIMAGTGLERLYFETNRGENRLMPAFRLLARIPGLRELFTTNAYGVWRRPADGR